LEPSTEFIGCALASAPCRSSPRARVCDGLPLYALSPDSFPIYACAQLIARHIDAGQLLNSSNVLTLPAPPASLEELTRLLRLHHGASLRSAEQEVRYFPSSVPHPHFRARGFILSAAGLPETSEDTPVIAVPEPCAYSAQREREIEIEGATRDLSARGTGFFGERDTKPPPEPKVFHRLERALQPSEYRLSASGELEVPLSSDQKKGPSFFVCESSSAAAKYAHKRAAKKDTCQCSTNPLEGPPTDAGVEMILEKRWPGSQLQWSKSGLSPDQIGGWHYVAAPVRPPGCSVAVLEAVARRECGEWSPCAFAASAEPAEDLLDLCRTSTAAVAVQALEYVVADEERDPAERFVAAILQYHAAMAEAPEVALFHSTALELLYDGADLLLMHQGESMEFWDLQEFLDELSARATYWNPCSPDQ